MITTHMSEVHPELLVWMFERLNGCLETKGVAQQFTFIQQTRLNGPLCGNTSRRRFF